MVSKPKYLVAIRNLEKKITRMNYATYFNIYLFPLTKKKAVILLFIVKLIQIIYLPDFLKIKVT